MTAGREKKCTAMLFFKIIICCAFGVLAIGSGASRGWAQTVDPDTVFTISVRSTTAYCGDDNGEYVPVIRRSAQSYRTVSSELSRVVARIKKSSGATRERLKKRRKELLALKNSTTTICKKGPTPTPTVAPTKTPAPTSTPGSISPTPTPTPAPTSSGSGCFVSGNNTKPGCFGIPAGLTGNIDRGQSIFLSNCQGCHPGGRGARTYSQLSAAFDSIAQMQPFRQSSQNLADLTAYLNRFNF